MAQVLVLVEHAGSDVRKVTTELLTLARRLGEPAAVWIGDGCDDAAVAALAEYGEQLLHTELHVQSELLFQHVYAIAVVADILDLSRVHEQCPKRDRGHH